LSELGAQKVTLEDALASCGIILLLVDHEEFKKVSHERLAGKDVIDTRGIWRTLKQAPTLQPQLKRGASQGAAIIPFPA
jgi:UDP-N-acetyl-D-mannosaminuronate dehydrogenase